MSAYILFAESGFRAGKVGEASAEDQLFIIEAMATRLEQDLPVPSIDSWIPFSVAWISDKLNVSLSNTCDALELPNLAILQPKRERTSRGPMMGMLYGQILDDWGRFEQNLRAQLANSFCEVNEEALALRKTFTRMIQGWQSDSSHELPSAGMLSQQRVGLLTGTETTSTAESGAPPWHWITEYNFSTVPGHMVQAVASNIFDGMINIPNSNKVIALTKL
ncbi:hypothetical protein DL768_011065 [Monosporascus sp. mg162]|nr:hypothetical protein DL768_011065 [Monosporascus sp. mg162]